MPNLVKLPSISIFLLLLSLGNSFAGIRGKVIDNYNLTVPNASIKFMNLHDPSKVYMIHTDESGYYEGDIPAVRIVYDGESALYENYPEPLTTGTIVPFFIDSEKWVTIEIFNIAGQHVRTLTDRMYNQGYHRVVWDGTNGSGGKVSDGIYLCSFVSQGIKKTIKVVVQGNTYGFFDASVFMQPAYPFEEEVLYRIEVTAENIENLMIESIGIYNRSDLDFLVQRIVAVPFATTGKYLGKYNGVGYDPVFIKGINLGVSIPGTYPGELAATREQYRNWIQKIAETGFNSIRLYTLHYPRFYEELANYNAAHQENPIYLFQGVWLNEAVPEGDLYNLTGEFKAEIEENIDCIHGNREISHRFGKAYGTFTADVSEWTMGFIIGREVHPLTIRGTNNIHFGNTSYAGEVFSLPGGTPTEVWITDLLEHTVTYEREKYAKDRPVSFSSWPTLDPLTHPGEVEPISTEDIESIDLATLEMTNAPAGYFASFHAYPYFPDFVSEEVQYQAYSDSEGPNSYLGYLHDLKAHYANYPLIIAEFGVPSSWGNAHFAHSGMHHGGHDEVQQGHYNNRLLQNILEAECGGGMMFAWIDEWFKNTWVCEPFASTGDRRLYWHNLTAAEQNFGLIAFDVGEPDYQEWAPVEQGACQVIKVEADLDRLYFHLQLTLSEELPTDENILLAFDTYRSDLGESVLTDGTTVNNRAEFLLDVRKGGFSQLYVTQAYDLFGIWHKVSGPEQFFHSIATDGAPWMPVRWKNNWYEDAIDYIGELDVRNPGDSPSSMDAVIFNGNQIHIRIPWTLLQFTDPTCMEVMDDDRATPDREVITSDGISITVNKDGCVIETPRYTWESWPVIPENVIERDKPSLQIVKEGLNEIQL